MLKTATFNRDDILMLRQEGNGGRRSKSRYSSRLIMTIF